MILVKRTILALSILFSSLLTQAQEGLQVNDLAPNFEAKDQNGKMVSLQELNKKSKVILVFYRGEWCPYCNKQLSQLEEAKSDIQRKGAILVAITPESAQFVAKTIEKSKASYPVLSDSDSKIMNAYKVAFELDAKTTERYKGYGIDLTTTNGSNGNKLPVPAVYVIENGKVTFRYFDTDYKNRLSVDELMKHI